MTVSDWTPTAELRRYDDTDKLTDPRLQQRWSRLNPHTREVETEWRDVPLVWGKPIYADPDVVDESTVRRVEDIEDEMIYSPEASDGTFDWPTKIYYAIVVVIVIGIFLFIRR